jgi:hypothetical protein
MGGVKRGDPNYARRTRPEELTRPEVKGETGEGEMGKPGKLP